MSELVRWKEYRVCQEIYKERLKQNETSADRVDSVKRMRRCGTTYRSPS
jgi:hypothetical protein